jgi:hypothetical protein
VTLELQIHLAVQRSYSKIRATGRQKINIVCSFAKNARQNTRVRKVQEGNRGGNQKIGGENRLRFRLPCAAGGYPPNVLQPTEAYCTNPTLVPPSSP